MSGDEPKSRFAIWREVGARLSLRDKLERDLIIAAGGLALFFLGGVISVGGGNNGGAPQHPDPGEGLIFVLLGIGLMIAGVALAIVNGLAWSARRRQARSSEATAP